MEAISILLLFQAKHWPDLFSSDIFGCETIQYILSHTEAMYSFWHVNLWINGSCKYIQQAWCSERTFLSTKYHFWEFHLNLSEFIIILVRSSLVNSSVIISQLKIFSYCVLGKLKGKRYRCLCKVSKKDRSFDHLIWQIVTFFATKWNEQFLLSLSWSRAKVFTKFSFSIHMWRYLSQAEALSFYSFQPF